MTKQVPNCEQAIIPDKKLAGYLLDHTHPQNGGKAAFYELVGFTTDNQEALRKALYQHICSCPLIKTEITPFGVRYVVEGWMPCANGKSYPIRSVWFVSSGEEFPKLVTAYPN